MPPMPPGIGALPSSSGISDTIASVVSIRPAIDAALVRSTAEATAKYVTGPYTFVDLDAGHWLPETRPEEVARAVRDRVAEI